MSMPVQRKPWNDCSAAPAEGTVIRRCRECKRKFTAHKVNPMPVCQDCQAVKLAAFWALWEEGR